MFNFDHKHKVKDSIGPRKRVSHHVHQKYTDLNYNISLLCSQCCKSNSNYSIRKHYQKKETVFPYEWNLFYFTDMFWLLLVL